ncbi:16S rRNA (guanine(527)-N(7))-methyltransferase RsmG [Gordonia sp. SID5947]|uniref:16S rRNA (guanine(527)-N(7))-methyltransferase RsmG n=1 Tax=Gordonia sp. SID5947 TaxID=2690315 RepID=UPI00136915DA|nr:16S rRNA (guanine(527)-N(7))-methyltransferase RsmG [Gordonia sp. SID5947]MYR07682.1 16S rRNA (guanine(527)-N(7))-methyltransferase RsmG [Gordonia sp. SID5947]
MFHVEPAEGDEPRPAPPEALTVFGDRLGTAERYSTALAGDGVVLGLIGPREVPRLWDRHVLNCAVIGDVIDRGETVVDIGSGAGLPGIPLAIARPDLVVTLVEPLLRRSEFLQRIVDELDLDVTVVRGRAEEKVVRAAVGEADVVTSRAVAPLERLAKWSGPLVREGGRMVAIKGSSAGEEIERDRDVVGRAGLSDLRVEQCGRGVLEVPTTVVIGTKRRGGAGSGRHSRTRNKKG